MTRVLESGRVNYWTGEEGRSFEREFAAYCGAAHGVALANGTLALEIALRVLGIGPGDEVIVAPRTFIASASSVVLVGATPVFVDVDSDSGNIDPAAAERAMTPATKAIMAVHLAGWPCDMDRLRSLAAAQELAIIEDCAQAHGAVYCGARVGSLGDIAAFSFCTDKIMSTGGEGGMLVTDSKDLWRGGWAFKDHGKDYDRVHGERSAAPVFRWVHESIGTNARMTEMQATIGRIQLKRLDDWLARRRHNAELLTSLLGRVPGLRVPRPPDGVVHANYKFYAYVDPSRLRSGWDRDRIVEEANAAGVPCLSGSCGEVYLERAFRSAGLGPAERLPVARQLAETSLMLPVHHTLEQEHLAVFAEQMTSILTKAMA